MSLVLIQSCYIIQAVVTANRWPKPTGSFVWYTRGFLYVHNPIQLPISIIPPNLIRCSGWYIKPPLEQSFIYERFASANYIFIWYTILALLSNTSGKAKDVFGWPDQKRRWVILGHTWFCSITIWENPAEHPEVRQDKLTQGYHHLEVSLTIQTNHLFDQLFRVL